MNTLPGDILTLIYSYDDTYRNKFKSVIDELENRIRNINNIKARKLLVSYNSHYLMVYKKRINGICPEIIRQEDLFYQDMYNIVLKELLIKPDFSKKLIYQLWHQIWLKSKYCWKKCYKEYLKNTITYRNPYYRHIIRNNRVINGEI